MTASNPQISEKSSGRLRTEVTGAVGTLMIDNEMKRNAMNLAMWQDMSAAIDRLVSDPNVRVIVLRGAGSRTFCAGADISEFEKTRSNAEKARNYDAINVDAFKAIKHAAKPTIAMIRGHCLGGGLGIALACDLRLAAEGSVFGIPAARLGIAYPLEAVSDILEAIGTATAKRLLFTAERLDTGHAVRSGLVDQAVPENQLEPETDQLCQTIAANAPLTLQAAKLAINAFAGGASPEELARAEAAAQLCFDSDDFLEGRNAFLEKRSPHFSGK